MMPRDAEKLLGGYAAGILTEEERSRLFQAALRDQALFDALADEDALRELLADPEARAKVLTALAEPAPPKTIPFYRRMPVLGAAASVFIALTAGLAYWHTQGKQPLKQRMEAPTEPQMAPAQPAAQSPPTPPQDKAPQRMTPAPKPAPLRDELLPVTPENLPAPSKPDAVDAALDRREKKRGEDAAKPLPALPHALSDEAPAGARKEKDQEEKASRSLAVPSSAVSGKAPAEAQKTEAYHRAWAKKSRPDAASDAGVSGSVSTQASAGLIATKETLPQPVWTYERLEDGRGRLRVIWSQGHLVLLLREGSTARVLTPSTERLASEGRREAVFLIPKGDAALDLYLLEGAPPADPATLPAEGPIQGFRHRIHPSGP